MSKRTSVFCSLFPNLVIEHRIQHSNWALQNAVNTYLSLIKMEKNSIVIVFLFSLMIHCLLSRLVFIFVSFLNKLSNRYKNGAELFIFSFDII